MNVIDSVIIFFLLVSISGIYSGLNVSLLSLNISDLERKAKLGNIYAKRILPLRRNSHLTIASIIISNVGAISATSLVLHNIMNGWAAGILSTVFIVVFSEVIPQAIFIRHSLILTGRLSFFMNIMIVLTYPLSKPLELLLNKIVGQETKEFMSRNELGILIAEHTHQKSSELDDSEIEIMMGALQLSDKQTRSIMTPIENTYWMTMNTYLTPEVIDQIKNMSYSRIPIFNENLTVYHGILLMKDLVDINFDTESYQVKDLYLHISQLVGSMTALDTLFRKFLTGGAHLLPVEKNDKIIGIVTIEDILEEILQREIIDETDKIKHRF